MKKTDPESFEATRKAMGSLPMPLPAAAASGGPPVSWRRPLPEVSHGDEFVFLFLNTIMLLLVYHKVLPEAISISS